MVKKDIERRFFGFLSRWFAPPLLKLLKASCKLKVNNETFPGQLLENNENFILAFWHGQMLPLLFYFGPAGFYTFISPHRDGEYIARALEGMGHYSLRTSLRDRRLRAVAEALKLAREGETLVVTPDGPVGPRCRAKPGIIQLSERARIPIIPSAGLAASGRYFSSWDRFCLPYPFGRIAVEFSEPLRFWEKDLPLEKKQKELENIMNGLTSSCVKRLGLQANPMPPAADDEV